MGDFGGGKSTVPGIGLVSIRIVFSTQETTRRGWNPLGSYSWVQRTKAKVSPRPFPFFYQEHFWVPSKINALQHRPDYLIWGGLRLTPSPTCFCWWHSASRPHTPASHRSCSVSSCSAPSTSTAIPLHWPGIKCTRGDHTQRPPSLCGSIWLACGQLPKSDVGLSEAAAPRLRAPTPDHRDARLDLLGPAPAK